MTSAPAPAKAQLTPRERANAALGPTATELVALYRSGHRGKTWHAAFARLETLTRLLTEGTPDDAD